MDENMLPEVGDKVRIKSDKPEFNNKTGVVVLIREHHRPPMAVVELEDAGQWYFRLQRLNVVKSGNDIK